MEKGLSFYVTAFIEGTFLFIFYFLPFDCVIVSPCTTEQWLAYYWWYGTTF
jgi:hypothetical protein